MASFDLVIRNGLVCDGRGGDPIKADVAVNRGRIAAVGQVSGQGAEDVDASGLLVTPGFVDIHTHFDGQATWEDTLGPSSTNGVTTAVIGNCGVGFAPCRPDERDMMIKLMEGVEDIPEAVMAVGIPWEWETFPEYLDWLGRRSYDIDLAALVPHSPVRVYVMGQRGADREPAKAADLQAMAAIVKAGIEAGALGFSTSRSNLHRTKAGALAPTVTSGEEEIKAIACAVGETGRGYIQLLDDFNDLGPEGATELEMIRRIARASGRPISFPVLEMHGQPGMWRHLLDGIEQANAEGLDLWASGFPRGVGMLLSIGSTLNPFSLKPSYQPLLNLSFEEKVQALRDPDLRRRLIEEEILQGVFPPHVYQMMQFETMFKLDDPAKYEPDESTLISAIAKRSGVSMAEAAYDAMLEFDGRQVLYAPGANMRGNSFDNVYEMMRHPNLILGLGDGGAHYGMICDSTFTTFMLTHWARDRNGTRFSVGEVVRMLSSAPAAAVGLGDRGLLVPGNKADINIIDHAKLSLGLPYCVRNLPGGGRRFTQDATGYIATFVNGVAIVRNDQQTGARPGRLVRGARESEMARAS